MLSMGPTAILSFIPAAMGLTAAPLTAICAALCLSMLTPSSRTLNVEKRKYKGLFLVSGAHTRFLRSTSRALSGFPALLPAKRRPVTHAQPAPPSERTGTRKGRRGQVSRELLEPAAAALLPVPVPASEACAEAGPGRAGRRQREEGGRQAGCGRDRGARCRAGGCAPRAAARRSR